MMSFSDLSMVVMAVLAINGIMGCLLYGIWRLFLRLIPKKMDIQISYILLRLILIFFLAPVFGGIRLGQFTFNEYWGVLCDLLPPGAYRHLRMASLVWLAVMGILLVRHVFLRIRMHRLARIGSMPACLKWQDSGEEVRGIIGLRKKVEIRERYGDDSAFVMGFRHPVIYVPVGEYDANSRRIILLHEMTHVQEGDLLWKDLVDIGRCIYWPIPVLWLIRRDMQVWSEYNCDYVSCGVLGSARTYFQLIQSMVSGHRHWTQSPWVAWMAQGSGDLVGRMRHMANQQRLTSVRRRWIFILAMIFTFGGSTTVGAATYSALREYRNAFWESLDVVYEEGGSAQEDFREVDDSQILADGTVGPDQWMSDETTFWSDEPESVLFNWVIPAGSSYVSPVYTAHEDQRIVIGCSADPSEAKVTVGILTENGRLLYTDLNGDLTQLFILREGGEYRMLIRNEDATAVEVGGYTMKQELGDE